MTKKFILSNNLTGEVVLNIDLVKKKWNKLWFISQWHNEYRLIKQMRSNTPIATLKATISESDAKLLINDLNLLCELSDVFTHAKTYRSNHD